MNDYTARITVGKACASERTRIHRPAYRSPSARVSTLLLLASLSPTPVAAQRLAGRVVHAGTGAAVQRALVLYLDSTGATLDLTWTNDDGLFERSVASGAYRLRVSALGLATKTTDPVVVRETDREVLIELDPAPVELSEIPVQGRAASDSALGPLAGYYERREWYGEKLGLGQFLDERDIRVHMSLRDLIRTVPGARFERIVSRQHGVQEFVRLQPSCDLARVWLDGTPIRLYTRDTRIRIGESRQEPQILDCGYSFAELEALAPIAEIVAIEVYRRPSELPPQFAGSDSRCGALVIWRTRGSSK